MFILSTRFGILCRIVGRANGPWVIHLRFGSAISSSSSSASSLSESDGFGSESVGSSLPLPHLLPSPLPPVLEFNPKITRVSCSPYRKTGGSSPSSIYSARPLSVARTTSSTDDTTTPVGVDLGFLDAYGRYCMSGISPTAFMNWQVMGRMEWRCWYAISCLILGGEE